MSRLIRIYTVFHSVLDFRQNPLFASMEPSQFKDGKVHKELRGERVNVMIGDDG